jgi:hypothetical protein
MVKNRDYVLVSELARIVIADILENEGRAVAEAGPPCGLHTPGRHKRVSLAESRGAAEDVFWTLSALGHNAGITHRTQPPTTIDPASLAKGARVQSERYLPQVGAMAESIRKTGGGAIVSRPSQP